MENKPKVILVIAAPGAGKSTQCTLLQKQFNLVHLSIGEILREERSKGTEESVKLDLYMKQFESTGKLMPVDLPLKYLVKRMRQKGWQKSTFLVDGFIKSVYMYQYWDQTVGDNTNLLACLYFECSRQTLMGRLKSRALTSAREDDKNLKLPEVRVNSFYQYTFPVLKIFQQKGLLKRIDAERSIEQVFTTTKTIVGSLLSK